MQRDCYRCGNPIEEQIAFCPACGAPQIRVSRPIEPLAEVQDLPEAELTSDQVAAISSTPANLVGRSGIQWKSFARTATPLAALTGIFTVMAPPLGFFFLFPASLIAAIYIYRRTRPAPMRGGQGARMGALMGFLSFIFFMIFLIAIFFLKPSIYKASVIDAVQQVAAWNPDQQFQQLQQLVSTPEGLIAFTVVRLAATLVFFLIIGVGSGALAVTLGRPRNHPQL
jgi:hypothetical protein